MRWSGLKQPLLVRIAIGLAIALFVVTRLVVLDRDAPPWDLAEYQPIDEFAYAVPAFNLHHYGSWTHQDVPYVPVEGSPMNVLQSAVTAATLSLDWSYWGLRLSSMLFALVAFGAMLATIRQLALRAAAGGVAVTFGVAGLVTAAALLLLFDFSFLVAGRIVEATIARVAVVSLLISLVARGTLLGTVRSAARSVAFGLLVGGSVWFVYVYNAFLIPAALLAVAMWAARHGSRREVARHVVLAGAGMAIATVAYFGLVLAVYGHGPAQWYDMWLSAYRESGRAAAFTPAGVFTILAGNIFRLDRPLLALSLLALPPFALWTWRSRDSTGVFVLSLLVAFVAQATIQSDYPQRKMLVLLPIALPIVIGGLLRVRELWQWAAERPSRLISVVVWSGLAMLGTIVLVLPPAWSHWSMLVRVLHVPTASTVAFRAGGAGLLLGIGAIAGLGAAAVLFSPVRSAAVPRVASLVLLAAILGPLASLDRAYVFENVSTTYRDAMTAAETSVNGEVTAGGLSFAMQLYNTGRPVLEGYFFGITKQAYETAVVRFFAEGRATSLFDYADGPTPGHWASLGFRLVETYQIVLPKGHTIGRYVYDPVVAP